MSNGDPFSAVSLVDRAKLYVFGLRDYLLGVIDQEKADYENAHVVLERAPVPADHGDCPSCHEKATMRLVAADSVRCNACGWQPRVYNPGGPNRKDLETFRGYDAEHKRKFAQGFGRAIWRLTGRK